MNNEIAKAVAAELKRSKRLDELGFDEDEFGQLEAKGCTVTFYSSCGEWEVDIVLPNGSVIGFDIAFDAVSGRTAEEVEAARAALAADEPFLKD